MNYTNIMPYYSNNMYRHNNPNDRYGGGFLLPFALGFVSSPLIFGATRPRPYYGPIYGPRPGYFPYY